MLNPGQERVRVVRLKILGKGLKIKTKSGQWHVGWDRRQSMDQALWHDRSVEVCDLSVGHRTVDLCRRRGLVRASGPAFGASRYISRFLDARGLAVL